LQDSLTLLTSPITPHLPKPLSLLLIFTLSAIGHSFLSYPGSHDLAFIQWFIFFTGSGVACMAERQFYHFTGRKVRGGWGRVWTWSMMFLLSWPMVKHQFDVAARR